MSGIMSEINKGTITGHKRVKGVKALLGVESRAESVIRALRKEAMSPRTVETRMS